MSYAVRISYPYADLVQFVEKVAESTDRCLVYEHEASRPHIHMLLRGCKVSTDTLKNWIKKALNINVKKTDWSFKSADDNDRYITYMSKGVLEPKFVKGFALSEIEARRSEWVDNANVNVNANVNANVNVKKVANVDVAALAYARYMENANANEVLTVSLRKVVKIVKDVCKENRKGRNYRNIANICQEVICDIFPEYFEDKVLSML